MTASGTPTPDLAEPEVRAQRRWLIGIGITLLFGTFGAVMAVLAYSNRTSTPASRAPARLSSPAPSGSAPAAVPDKPGRGSGRK